MSQAWSADIKNVQLTLGFVDLVVLTNDNQISRGEKTVDSGEATMDCSGRYVLSEVA